MSIHADLKSSWVYIQIWRVPEYMFRSEEVLNICSDLKRFWVYMYSLHVNGSYWKTGWESRIIDLNYTLILLNQRRLQATYKLLISLSFAGVDLLSQYKPFLLNLCTDYYMLMYSFCPLYTLYTPCSGVSRSSLEWC